MNISNSMEFTGERYVPSLDGAIKYEHLHRYAMCLQFVTGKSVLDIAAGEGYGSALLAKVAEFVVGVDIDSESVEYAKLKYSSYENLNFLVGSCESVPLADHSVDVVTSFETIEHHDKHEEMMQEIKRVLKPGGLLILSSPNRLVHTDEANHSNPFHVKELYYSELVDLLNRYFNYYQIYGQRLGMGSFVFSLESTSENQLKAYTGNIDKLYQQVCSLKSPLYFVAICSDESDRIQTSLDSLYIDASDDLLNTYMLNLDESQKVMRYFETKLKQTQVELKSEQSELDQRQAELKDTQSQLQNTQSQLQSTQSQLQSTQSQLQSTQTEVAELQLQLQKKHVELEQFKQQLNEMENSRFWKVRQVLFKLKNIFGI
ncbi:class I SAM-dependent methyltransferase [Calothrix sp. UHCC 0171]|uniref:class I SAM-dependent methyltransferase n=1 Tax=Calothrix sp. UHCC 0171 TaxID=3110245 RepID=UPI002B1F8098|nr:class I SAM-dependent methyltransferase [Calothrix sp. UHCC 0171]MEA5569986.1 class I SAM-dependent methyltransferase [Calothrix sp. UHCC 0171]